MSAEFPVDSYREAVEHLRRPFTPSAVKFKVQATWKTGALIVSYIDSRLATERLNLVCPHLWSTEFTPVQGGLECALTIDGITRRNLGSDYSGKGLYSDAIKRAAVDFGVGVSLYSTPRIMLDVGPFLAEKIGKDGKPIKVLTVKGEAECRKRYLYWLKEHGEEAFGKPLDHGDRDDSVGDSEDGNETPVPNSEATPSDTPERMADLVELIEARDLNQDDRNKLRDWIKPNGSVDNSRVTLAVEHLDRDAIDDLRAVMA